jgi:hypothetical protein
MTARVFFAIALAVTPAAWAAAGQTDARQQQPAVANADANPDALVLQEFKQRIDKYMELHDRLEKSAPRLEETKDPEKIRASQDSLAAQIRSARADARPGDIFTPEIRTRFRQLMYPQTTGPGGEGTKATIKEDSPGNIPLKINASYPASKPLPTIPPNVLKNLPRLPGELEYRIVERHLILRDVHANIIVDYIPNAIRP